MNKAEAPQHKEGAYFDPPEEPTASAPHQGQTPAEPTVQVVRPRVRVPVYQKGLTVAAVRRVTFSPDGALRILEWFLSLISFALMSNWPLYTQENEFKFLIAAGVLTWIWTMAWLMLYLWDAVFPNAGLMEFVGDLILSFFEFIAGVAAAAACEKNPHGSHANSDAELCDGINQPIAAAAFAFLACTALLGSAFISFRKWRTAED
jgi:hypothetical protein